MTAIHCRREEDGDAWNLESGSVPDPSRWLARITATLPSSYVTVNRQVTLSGGSVDVQVRAWSDDAAWGRRTLRLLADALPRLDEAMGLPYQPSGPLVIVESLPESGAVLREPAASDVDIAIGYTEPAFTVLHQVAHLWLPATLAGDRWIREGFASHAAANVARELGVDLPFDAERAAQVRRADAFRLSAGRRRGEPSAGSVRLRRRLGHRRCACRGGGGGGPAPGLAARGRRARRVHAALRRPPTVPVAATVPADSRHLLDQLEAVSDGDVVPIFRRWVLDEASAAQLPARREARAAYDALSATAGDWGTPDPVRLALAGWRFADAQTAMAETTDWLADRDALLARIDEAGLVAPSACAPSTSAVAAASGSPRAEFGDSGGGRHSHGARAHRGRAFTARGSGPARGQRSGRHAGRGAVIVRRG